MNFYVYEHWRPDTGSCFYVGKGSAYRARSMKSRNKHHKAIVEKLRKQGLSVEVRIIAEGLGEEEAFRLEMERIALYDNLCNMTNGGEGFSGGRHDAASRAKISAASKRMWEENKEKLCGRFVGEKNPFFGKTHSEETRKRLSEKLTGRKCPNRPPLSAEARRTISETLKAKGIKPPHRVGFTLPLETRLKQSKSIRVYFQEKKAAHAASLGQLSLEL